MGRAVKTPVEGSNANGAPGVEGKGRGFPAAENAAYVKEIEGREGKNAEDKGRVTSSVLLAGTLIASKAGIAASSCVMFHMREKPPAVTVKSDKNLTNTEPAAVE